MEISGVSTSDGRNAKNVIWIIWAAILLAVPVYAIIGQFAATSSAADNAGNLPLLIPAFVAISIGASVIVLFMARKLFAKGGNYLAFEIIRFAISESVAIYGLILKLCGGGAISYLFFIWSAVLLLLVMPTRSDRDKFEYHVRMVKDKTID
jgi:hypothetical protein